MSDDRQDDELHEQLQSRIPAPGPGYWEAVDGQLQAASNNQDHEETSDTDADVSDVRPVSVAKPDEPMPEGVNAPTASLSSRNLLIAAALVLIAGIGFFAISNRSSDDPLDVATASESAAGDGQDDVTNPAIDGEGALSALQARLAGEVPGAGEEGAGSAGPFCFTADDAYDFVPRALDGHRDLFSMDVAFDGFVNFFALQGETVLVSGSGYPSEAGALVAAPFVEAGPMQVPATYTIVITDADVSLEGVEAALAATPCLQVQDRVDTMFALLQGPPAPVSADWPPADAVLSSAGLGPIRIGMMVSELSAELGTELALDTIELAQAGACGWISTTAISDDVWVIVELTSATDAIVRRVSIRGGSWETPSGIRLGLTEQDVIDTFPGQIESSPHVYTEGNYLTFQPNDASDPNTVQFVSEFGIVAEIRTGDRSWVGLVEGCA